MEALALGVFLLLLMVPFILTVFALVDLARRPAWQWETAQQNQIVWVLIVLLLGCIGPIIYLMVAKPKLDDVGGGGG